MGIGDRHSRRTTKFDSRELAKLTSKDADATHTAEPMDLDEVAPVEPAPAELAAQVAQRARTSTVHDPLTTGLLAEVARRSKTIEVSPEMVEEAKSSDPDRAHERDRAANDTPNRVRR